MKPCKEMTLLHEMIGAETTMSLIRFLIELVVI